MAKYDEGFKRAIVLRYLSGLESVNALASRHGVHRAMIQRWIAAYELHGDAALRKKFSHYSAEFKLSVLQRMDQEMLSAQQVIALFDIRGGAGVISVWRRQYDRGGLQALQPKIKPKGRSPNMPHPPTAKPATSPSTEDTRSREDLLKEVEYLRAEVAYLKKLDALVRAKRLAAQAKRKP